MKDFHKTFAGYPIEVVPDKQGFIAMSPDVIAALERIFTYSEKIGRGVGSLVIDGKVVKQGKPISD